MLLQLMGLLTDDERGLTSIEYTLVASLVSVFILGGILLLGDGLRNQYGMVGNTVNNYAP